MAKYQKQPQFVQGFSSLDTDSLLAALRSSLYGPSAAVIKKRIKEQAHYFNTENKFKKQLKIFLRQLTNPLVMLLTVAVILSALLGESSDSLIILAILLLTVLLSFWQELKAGTAIEKLRKMVEMKHTVIRTTGTVQLFTREVIPGDILLFDAGDIIPADCLIIESNELHVNESSLTGESYPVEKTPGLVAENMPLSKKSNCLWQGTNIISGSAKAVAVNTAGNTIFGRMAHSLEVVTETAFEKGIKHFGFFLLRITIILSTMILAANLYFKKPFFDSVMFSLALAVGMAPELLPAIMTFAMSAGAKKMLKKKVIVKKLSSIFNFGEVNVLCTDKTGTLTEGDVVVKDIVNLQGETDDHLKQMAFLNASMQSGFTNPVDSAITKLKLNANGYEKVNEIPYDFLRRRLSVAVKKNGTTLFITKGAFNNVLDICSSAEDKEKRKIILKDLQRTEITGEYIRYSQQGYRVLGLSYKPVNNNRISRADEYDMIFLGFILLHDPLKETALASVNRVEQMGIQIKIITGDNKFAAIHIAESIGLKNPVLLTGDDLRKLSPESMIIKARETMIFAEIEPQQKEQIVKALQKSLLTVAYVGDGINDVAAINAADIGISTDNAADVAKEAADFVLLEKDLSVLADGICEGRRSFANSMKYILITTGATFGNMFSVAAASLFLPFLPMLPKQLLLTNLITDLPFLSIASDNVDEEELKLPGRWDLKKIQQFMIVFGFHSSLFDLLTFYMLYSYYGLSNERFQTGWFLESSITELLILFIIRTKKTFIKSKPGKLLLITGILAFIITFYLPFSPFAASLGFSIAHGKLLATITLILITYAVTADFLKVIFFKIHAKRALHKSDGIFHKAQEALKH